MAIGNQTSKIRLNVIFIATIILSVLILAMIMKSNMNPPYVVWAAYLVGVTKGVFWRWFFSEVDKL